MPNTPPLLGRIGKLLLPAKRLPGRCRSRIPLCQLTPKSKSTSIAFFSGSPLRMSDEISFADFAGVASTKIHGEYPIIVGGQAVNIWALVYLPRLRSDLASLAPFVSKDLDLYGSRQILEGLAEKYGVTVKWSPPRFPGIGQMVIPFEHKSLTVELLSHVKGLRGNEAANAVNLTIQNVELRVLDPIHCLKAKVANAADLPQDDRQDVKHVQIMILCVREFVRDLLARISNSESERVVVNCLESMKAISDSTVSRIIRAKWDIDVAASFPVHDLLHCPSEKIQNFCHHRLPANDDAKPQ